LRNSINDVSWKAEAKEGIGLEDEYAITLKPETARSFGQNLAAAAAITGELDRFVPQNVTSTTRYNFNDAQAAWFSAVQAARTGTDNLSGQLIGTFSAGLFEPYGVEDPDMFLKAAGSALQTAAFDAEGEESVIIAHVRDLELLKRSVAKEINFAKPAETLEGASVWRTADGEVALAVVGDVMILGDAAGVENCLRASSQPAAAGFGSTKAPIATIGTDTDRDARLVEILGERRNDETPLVQTYRTETTFGQNGIERITTSSFGLIGTIIEQFKSD
jgi:hypothetical protein